METKQIVQIIFTAIVVFVVVVTIIKVMKKDKKQNYISEGMFLGIEIGKNKRKKMVESLFF